jgi:hypothetical protein
LKKKKEEADDDDDDVDDDDDDDDDDEVGSDDEESEEETLITRTDHPSPSPCPDFACRLRAEKESRRIYSQLKNQAGRASALLQRLR